MSVFGQHEVLPHVAVVGLGYVGCVTAACLAQLGYRVTGVDIDEYKVGSINARRTPFYEPGLDELVASVVSPDGLSATTHTATAIKEADIAFICVGTPSLANGQLGLSQVKNVVNEIRDALPERKSRNKLIVALRSTTLPGVCDSVIGGVLGRQVSVVANPEFLREGSALRDFRDPPLVLVGSDDYAAAAVVADLYRSLTTNVRLLSLRTAEMVKYACNAFHAMKVAFANEIGCIAALLEADPLEVMAAVCSDKHLSISSAYLKPGLPFGGSCLPKDLRALSHASKCIGLKTPLIDSVLASNHEHLLRVREAVLGLSYTRIGVFGLAFKENTDDLRESAVVALLKQLIRAGRELHIYDPHINVNCIYGSNRQYLMEMIPDVERLMDRSIEDMLAWAEVVVMAQRPGEENLQLIVGSGLPLFDLVDPQVLRDYV